MPLTDLASVGFVFQGSNLPASSTALAQLELVGRASRATRGASRSTCSRRSASLPRQAVDPDASLAANANAWASPGRSWQTRPCPW